MPSALWKMDVTHYPHFGNLKYIHTIFDTYSLFTFAISQTGEWTSYAIKPLKTAMLIMGIPWSIKTDNDSAYISQQFREFLKEWGIKHTTGFQYNPQGQASIESTNWSLKENLQKVTKETKKNPHLALTETLFTKFFLPFDDKGLSSVYK